MLNGVKFVPRDIGELVDGAAGFFKRSRAGVALFNGDGERVGGINRNGVMYRSSRLPDGRLWHQCTNPDMIPLYESYRQQTDECRAAL